MRDRKSERRALNRLGRSVSASRAEGCELALELGDGLALLDDLRVDRTVTLAQLAQVGTGGVEATFEFGGREAVGLDLADLRGAQGERDRVAGAQDRERFRGGLKRADDEIAERLAGDEPAGALTGGGFAQDETGLAVDREVGGKLEGLFRGRDGGR